MDHDLPHNPFVGEETAKAIERGDPIEDVAIGVWSAEPMLGKRMVSVTVPAEPMWNMLREVLDRGNCPVCRSLAEAIKTTWERGAGHGDTE
jgi:hypothetical protein